MYDFVFSFPRQLSAKPNRQWNNRVHPLNPEMIAAESRMARQTQPSEVNAAAGGFVCLGK
jgi:hypothetical protein